MTTKMHQQHFKKPTQCEFWKVNGSEPSITYTIDFESPAMKLTFAKDCLDWLSKEAGNMVLTVSLGWKG